MKSTKNQYLLIPSIPILVPCHLVVNYGKLQWDDSVDFNQSLTVVDLPGLTAPFRYAPYMQWTSRHDIEPTRH